MIEIKSKKNPLRSFAGAAIVLSVLAIAGQNVLASLNATVSNTSQNVNSGDLKLNLADAGAGFSTSISNLAPGDVVNRYVTITNSGSLDGKDLNMAVAASGPEPLKVDGVTTKALRIKVTSCGQPWSGGICGSGESVEIPATALGSLAAKTYFQAPNLNSGAVKYLQIKVQLPDQNETTINGVLPNPTVQNGTVALTYTFDLAQRVASESNS